MLGLHHSTRNTSTNASSYIVVSRNQAVAVDQLPECGSMVVALAMDIKVFAELAETHIYLLAGCWEVGVRPDCATIMMRRLAWSITPASTP